MSTSMSGSSGAFGIAGPECRQPAQPRCGMSSELDVDVVAEIGERPIFDLGRRRAEEGALRIGERDIVQANLAEDRAFDPADMDLEPGGRLERVDLADDEAAAGIGVEPEEEGADQDDDRGRTMAVHLATVRAGGRGGRWRSRRHQKACPIET